MQNTKTFQQVWALISDEFATTKVVRNWTVDKGFFGEDFKAKALKYEVHCVLPKGNAIQVPVADFEKVYAVWAGYLTREVGRAEIRDITRFSKYIISILHQIL